MSTTSGSKIPVTDYEFTDEQREAILELEKLTSSPFKSAADSDSEDDYEYSPMPDYDVTERLKEINEQWGKEPLPEEDIRQRFIEFKENLVLGVAEPPQYNDYSTDEELGGGDSESTREGSIPGAVLQDDINCGRPGAPSTKPSNQYSDYRNPDNHYDIKASPKFVDEYSPPGSPAPSEDLPLKISAKFIDGYPPHSSPAPLEDKTLQTSARFIDAHSPPTSLAAREDFSLSTQPVGATHTPSEQGDYNQTDSESVGPSVNANDEKVLQEVNGKFELISVRELQARGMASPFLDLDSVSSSSSQVDSTYSADQVQQSRGRSAINRSDIRPSPPVNQRRTQSATSRRANPLAFGTNDFSYRSPYAMTPEQKEMRHKREQLMKERQKLFEERKKLEKRQKKEEAESAFMWWLAKKKEEAEKKHQSDKSETTEPEKSKKDKKESEEKEKVFADWCAAKAEQQKQERLLKQRQQKEREDVYFIRSREECDKAFNRWLSTKRKESQAVRKSVSLGRKQRKVKKYAKKPFFPLTQILASDQPPKYVAYYGYRF